MAFKNINISELSFNPFTKIGKEWALITGGDRENYNTMTVSWGQLGVLWNKDVFTCYIRPNRYTYNYLENSESFTVSFFSEEYRKALAFCGAHSGRERHCHFVGGSVCHGDLPKCTAAAAAPGAYGAADGMPLYHGVYGAGGGHAPGPFGKILFRCCGAHPRGRRRSGAAV